MNWRRRASNLAQKLRLAQLPRGSAALFASLAVANVSGYVFYIVASRVLPPNRYGALGALVAIITIIAVPATAIHTVAARRVATLNEREEHAEIRSVLWTMIRGLALFAGVIAAILLALSPFVSHFLHLGSVAPAMLLAVFVFVAIQAPVLRGAVHGLVHYRAFAAAVLTIAVMRVGLGIPLLSFGWDVTGALTAFLVAEVSSIFPALWGLRPILRQRAAVLSVPGVFQELWRAALALAGFAAATNLDVAQVRHYFPDRASGIYAAAAVVGRGVLVGSMSVTLLVFPRFASPEGKTREARSVLSGTLAATAAIGVGATIFVGAAQEPLLRLIFGEQYGPAASVALVSAAGSTLYSLVGVIMYFHLAKSSRVALLAIPALGVQSVAISLWHRSILGVAWITVLTAAGLLLANAIFLFLRRPAIVEVVANSGGPPTTRTAESKG